jgi:hypothetical protein
VTLRSPCRDARAGGRATGFVAADNTIRRKEPISILTWDR